MIGATVVEGRALQILGSAPIDERFVPDDSLVVASRQDDYHVTFWLGASSVTSRCF